MSHSVASRLRLVGSPQAPTRAVQRARAAQLFSDVSEVATLRAEGANGSKVIAQLFLKHNVYTSTFNWFIGPL